MATRLIVTSHPDVACDVCGRRLLRGEQPDVFLSGGQRRTVCELCAPRAAHEGWLRETDTATLGLRPARSRRTRSLLGRLRQLREPGEDTGAASAESPPIAAPERDDALYDFLDSPLSTPARAVEPVAAAPRPARRVQPAPADASSIDGDAVQSDERARRAVELFNAGEQPRRLAGIARSLGAPVVSVQPLAADSDTVAVVLAWELCWYRYEVDLVAGAGPRLAGEGMELGELAPADLAANAVADERGELALLD
jgi:hypothetical protein